MPTTARSQLVTKVWRPSDALGLGECFRLFGKCISDPHSDPRQWPSSELSSEVIRAELTEYLDSDFVEQYHSLISTYVSNMFEREYESKYDDLDSFLEAKHKFDNQRMSRSGTRVLKALQQTLQPTTLESCSAEIKRALFLVLIGTIDVGARARREACSEHQVNSYCHLPLRSS